MIAHSPIVGRCRPEIGMGFDAAQVLRKSFNSKM